MWSIPACAGKPASSRMSASISRVHPRVCGEAPDPGAAADAFPGPSPRVRGSRYHVVSLLMTGRSIPACAGKPGGGGNSTIPPGVHPRVCGEAIRKRWPGADEPGPSPRVRGSLPATAARQAARGSIPACAGKPWPGGSSRWPDGVHPRVCGEAARAPAGGVRVQGPSPRVRGSLRSPCSAAPRVGSIPACAGKPRWRPGRGIWSGVHPRVCGEAPRWRRFPGSGRGPSPRVRGSPRSFSWALFLSGSIPACAGKPPRRRPARSGRGVHPRVCGEADQGWSVEWARRGPSPRVRGSPEDLVDAQVAVGSIPACAGKPAYPRRRPDPAQVHPRVCGEATDPVVFTRGDDGPSPRVRGSPEDLIDAQVSVGSIPACAGKPVAAWRASIW